METKARISVRVQNLIAFTLILFFAVVNTISVTRDFALTTDEDKHYLYGEKVLEGDPSRFNPSTMPVTAFNALPKAIGTLVGGERLGWYPFARMVTIFFSCLTAYLVFHWARRLYGFVPALFSLILYVLDPNIIAHSQLVTTDIYTTGTFVFAFFTLWKFARERNFRNGLLCLFALGLSQLAKYTAIILYPLFLGTLLIYDLSSRNETGKEKERIWAFTFRYLKYGIAMLVVSILIINLGFLFDHTFMAFGEYQFRSSFLQKIQASAPGLESMPVPLPSPYLNGLDYMFNFEQSGNSPGNIYLLGHVRTGTGFPGYYFVASLLKVPISAQIIMLFAFLAYFSRRRVISDFLKNEMFLLIPVLFFAVYFNFFFKTQVGIRYYLPVFPFLYIFSGSLFIGWEKFSLMKKRVVGLLVVYLIGSVISYHPYYLSYFNEIVLDRKYAYKYLADSNLDWGQDKYELDHFLYENPDAVYKPQKVRTGLLVVRINDLVGVTTDPGLYTWLRDNFEPSGMIGHSYLIYDITPEEINPLCGRTVSCD
ncbi:MAG TPA: glycosyltransferase family 39 protein [Anaerolineales bacterium]